MRKIKHLEQCDYIVKIGQRLNQLLTLSNRSNCYLSRTWDKLEPVFEADLHAKFNSGSFNGMNIEVRLLRNGVITSSVVSGVQLYTVDNNTFAKTLINTFVPIQVGQSWVCNIPQSALNPIELTAEKTFYVSCTLNRLRNKFKISRYFNHIGAYDSLFRLRQDVTFLELTKLDE